MSTATPPQSADSMSEADRLAHEAGSYVRVRALQADAREDYAQYRDSTAAATARDNLGFARIAAKLVRS